MTGRSKYDYADVLVGRYFEVIRFESTEEVVETTFEENGKRMHVTTRKRVRRLDLGPVMIATGVVFIIAIIAMAIFIRIRVHFNIMCLR
jgi:hypothetical protein